MHVHFKFEFIGVQVHKSGRSGRKQVGGEEVGIAGRRRRQQCITGWREVWCGLLSAQDVQGAGDHCQQEWCRRGC